MAISPDPTKHELISRYCLEQGIDPSRVRFLPEESHTALLHSWDRGPLDLVLIDGAHAFPYPILDWFLTAPDLRVGGYLLVDDAYLPSINPLVRYLRLSSSWELEQVLSYRTVCFRKLDDVAPTFVSEEIAFDRHPRFNYLPWLQRPAAWARYRLFDPRGPLRGLAQLVIARRGR